MRSCNGLATILDGVALAACAVCPKHLIDDEKKKKLQTPGKGSNCINRYTKAVTEKVCQSPKLGVFQVCHPQCRNPWLLRLCSAFERLRLDRTGKPKPTCHVIISL